MSGLLATLEEWLPEAVDRHGPKLVDELVEEGTKRRAEVAAALTPLGVSREEADRLTDAVLDGLLEIKPTLLRQTKHGIARVAALWHDGDMAAAKARFIEMTGPQLLEASRQAARELVLEEKAREMDWEAFLGFLQGVGQTGAAVLVAIASGAYGGLFR